MFIRGLRSHETCNLRFYADNMANLPRSLGVRQLSVTEYIRGGFWRGNHTCLPVRTYWQRGWCFAVSRQKPSGVSCTQTPQRTLEVSDCLPVYQSVSSALQTGFPLFLHFAAGCQITDSGVLFP
jgi:hypothetical protein